MSGFNNAERVRFTTAQKEKIKEYLKDALKLAHKNGCTLNGLDTLGLFNLINEEVDEIRPEYNDFDHVYRREEKQGVWKLRRQEQRVLGEIIFDCIEEQGISIHNEYKFIMALIEVVEDKNGNAGGLRASYKRFIRDYEKQKVMK